MQSGSVRLYPDKNGDWRWQVKASGRIIGASNKGYKRKVDCTTNLHRVCNALTIPIKWSNDYGPESNRDPDQSKLAESG